MIDRWISKIAKKDFTETINWIDAFVVFLLGSLVAALILLDTTPVDISVPVKVIAENKLLLNQDYVESITHKKELSLKNKDLRYTVKIKHTTFASPHHILITVDEKLPYPIGITIRLVVFRKTILDMLLRTKSFENR